MNKTKIDWADMTWNPVTGCLHDCPYCYARKIARRFAARLDPDPGHGFGDSDYYGEECEVSGIHDNYYLFNLQNKNNPYPYGFDPTIRRHRLDEPSQIKKPQNIFVCSMADLFGKWVPLEWIKEVFGACVKAPQHRYLFLTKNPNWYFEILSKEKAPDNFWFGSTITNGHTPFFYSRSHNTFLSIGPIQDSFGFFDHKKFVDWVIIGAETGNRKGKINPKREWINGIVNQCRDMNVPVFMKNSLLDIWKEPLIQEYPW